MTRRDWDVVVVAHRGMVAGFPENTLAACSKAIELGFSVIEIDLRATSDGHIVVMHDDTVDRTTSGSGEVRHMTLAEISPWMRAVTSIPNSLISGFRHIGTCSKRCAAPGQSWCSISSHAMRSTMS